MPPPPHFDAAIIDIAKLRDYCLNPLHPRGRHKAHVFRAAIGLERSDAEWLASVMTASLAGSDAVGVGSSVYGTQWRVDIPIRRQDRVCRGKIIVDGSNRGNRPPVHKLLGFVMARAAKSELSLLDVVALLFDRPAAKLTRGQVGTVVEVLDNETVLVEFTDDNGRAYAIEPCVVRELMVLHYESQFG